MAKRDIIVVGASAGGITALSELVNSIPQDFKASIFVVLHMSPSSPGVLPRYTFPGRFVERSAPC